MNWFSNFRNISRFSLIVWTLNIVAFNFHSWPIDLFSFACKTLKVKFMITLNSYDCDLENCINLNAKSWRMIVLSGKIKHISNKICSVNLTIPGSQQKGWHKLMSCCQFWKKKVFILDKNMIFSKKWTSRKSAPFHSIGVWVNDSWSENISTNAKLRSYWTAFGLV